MTTTAPVGTDGHEPGSPHAKLIHLGSLGGTTIDVEPTFVILCVFFVVMDLERRVPMSVAALWIPVLLISVLVHELGHAAVNALLGFGRSMIILGGFGGRTLSQRQGRPWQDMLVSLAGPFCSLLLAALFLGLHSRALHPEQATLLTTFVAQMYEANYGWGLLNLIPIYPLDGGHVLRSIAAHFSNPWRAFQISTWTSICFGAVAIAYAVLNGQIFLAVLAAMMVVQNFQAWSLARANSRTHSENIT